MNTSPSALQGLRDERDRFVAFSFATSDMLVEIDGESGKVLYASGAVKSVAGVDEAKLKTLTIYDILAQGDHLVLHRQLQNAQKGGRIAPVLLRLGGVRAEPVPVIVGICCLKGDNRFHLSFLLATKFVGHGHDGARDEVTGLLDAARFADKAQAALEEAAAQGQACKMTFLDLGEYKAVLQKNPAQTAEEFMLGIGAYLRASSIDGDSAGLIEDDKYGLVHADHVSDLEIRSYVEELGRSVLKGADEIQAKTAVVDISDTTVAAQDTAKALLYSINKFAEGGADTFTITSLSDSIGGLMEDALGKVKSFRSTVSGNAFFLVFQPIVATGNGEAIHHYEALSRFYNNASPFETICFAEQVGLIQEFDLAVCQKALESLLLLGKQPKLPHIAVNVSAQSLESGMFLAGVQAIFATYPQLRGNILFELTESQQVKNYDQVNEALQTLRRAGHPVCLDDVGAGATSFHYLRSLQVDYIKIDGSYIRTMHQSKRDKAFVQAIHVLAASLNVKTIAEMVETSQQAAELANIGVDYCQGWLYGKPATELCGIDLSQINVGAVKSAAG